MQNLYVNTMLVELWVVEDVRKIYEKIAEIPFNSKNKWALSVHRLPDEKNKVLLLMKGATEYMINRSLTILTVSASYKQRIQN